MACTICEQTMSFMVRVTGGDIEGAHQSEYACELCQDATLARIRQTYPDAKIVRLHRIHFPDQVHFNVESTGSTLQSPLAEYALAPDVPPAEALRSWLLANYMSMEDLIFEEGLIDQLEVSVTVFDADSRAESFTITAEDLRHAAEERRGVYAAIATASPELEAHIQEQEAADAGPD